MQKWRQNRQLPQCFRVHQLGLVPGEQSIHRAEICAIIQASKLARLYDCPAEVWTDSQVAIDEWNRLESDALPLWPDLAHELGKVHSSNIRLCKVAAHANLDRLWGFPQWCCAGNTVADLAAKSTLTRDFELVIEASNSTAEFLSDQQDALLVFWKYLCRLSLEENALLKELQKGTVELPERETDQAASVTVQRTAATSVASWLLQQATGGENWQLPPPPREVLLACSWPPWFTVPLWQWTRGLRWSPDETPGRAKTGTTYLELLVSFVICTGVCPPEGLAPALEQQECPRTFANPVNLRSLTHSMVTAVRQFERLFGRPIWPGKRRKCFSLRALGVQRAHNGVRMRLNFPQEEVTAELHSDVLKASSVLPLQRFARNYVGPCYFSRDLQKTWNLYTQTQRSGLARSLRNTR